MTIESNGSCVKQKLIGFEIGQIGLKGDNVFVGSGVELVAPVLIEDGATIGAGSTISKPAPKGKLTLERAKQKTIDGWQRPDKTKDK